MLFSCIFFHFYSIYSIQSHVISFTYFIMLQFAFEIVHFYLFAIFVSDAKISEVSRQTLISALDGDRSQDLHLSLCQSVCEGVRLMYKSYQNKKWAQVLYICLCIIQDIKINKPRQTTALSVLAISTQNSCLHKELTITNSM